MKHARIIGWLLIAAAAAGTGCRPIVDVTDTRCRIGVHITLPQIVDSLSVHSIGIDSVSLTLRDLNMGRSYTLMPDSFAIDSMVAVVFALDAPIGYFDITAAARMLIDSNSVPLRAYQQGVSLVVRPKGVEAPCLQMEANVVQANNNDFVFAEIAISGTRTPEGKNYLGDSYFVLYNNTLDTLYADGVVLLESKLKTSQKYLSISPYFPKDYFGADAIYRIPGSGKDHPVAPGGVVLIVDNAQDHREANPNSFDLSEADFEWYDQSSSATITDIDNPIVPNMDKLYCYTLTLWVPNRQGNTSFALARFPAEMSDSAYLAGYRQSFDYVLVTNVGTNNMSSTCYIVPNAWVIDCVNLSPRTTYQWTPVSAALDAGWTYIGDMGSDKQRFGKCVRRRERVEESGRRVLQDTNNSSVDFLPAQVSDPAYFTR